MIDDAALFRALEWLKDNAKPAAEARAERLFIEEQLPHLRARIAVECMAAGDSAAAADMKAKASDAYKIALDGLRAAVEKDEYMRFQRTRADAIIEIWRSLSANQRSIAKAV
ncbi:MAG: hypothetical protein H0V81_10845 [Solirubrobacterales bacterium]|nr:hypothetical protein [Solirubrobacterales bacterium]